MIFVFYFPDDRIFCLFWFCFLKGWWIASTMTFTDCDGDSGAQYQCSASLTTVGSSSSSSSSYIAGAAVLGVSALAALLFIRRRRVATINLLQEEKRAALVSGDEGQFEMMSDSVRV